jgi:hypothetical protein
MAYGTCQQHRALGREDTSGCSCRHEGLALGPPGTAAPLACRRRTDRAPARAGTSADIRQGSFLGRRDTSVSVCMSRIDRVPGRAGISAGIRRGSFPGRRDMPVSKACTSRIDRAPDRAGISASIRPASFPGRTDTSVSVCTSRFDRGPGRAGTSAGIRRGFALGREDMSPVLAPMPDRCPRSPITGSRARPVRQQMLLHVRVRCSGQDCRGLSA